MNGHLIDRICIQKPAKSFRALQTEVSFFSSTSSEETPFFEKTGFFFSFSNRIWELGNPPFFRLMVGFAIAHPTLAIINS